MHYLSLIISKWVVLNSAPSSFCLYPHRDILCFLEVELRIAIEHLYQGHNDRTRYKQERLQGVSWEDFQLVILRENAGIFSFVVILSSCLLKLTSSWEVMIYFWDSSVDGLCTLSYWGPTRLSFNVADAIYVLKNRFKISLDQSLWKIWKQKTWIITNYFPQYLFFCAICLDL